MKTQIEYLQLLRTHSARITKRQAKNHLIRIIKRVKEGRVQL
jgi:hypothetical protein